MELFSSEGMSVGQVDNILFYNENGVQYETDKGWLNAGNNIYKEIHFPEDADIKLRRKLDFTRGGAFYMRKRDEVSGQLNIWLYIPCEMFGFKFLRVDKHEEANRLAICYTTVSEVHFNGMLDNGEKKVCEHHQKLYSYKYEDTPYGVECIEMAKDFSKLMYRNIDKYGVANLREKYDIKLKK